MKTEFTKGKWRVGRKSTKNNDGRFQCYVGGGIIDSPICTVFNKTQIGADANALLISKAPELLNALIDIAEKIDFEKYPKEYKLINKLIKE